MRDVWPRDALASLIIPRKRRSSSNCHALGEAELLAVRGFMFRIIGATWGARVDPGYVRHAHADQSFSDYQGGRAIENEVHDLICALCCETINAEADQVYMKTPRISSGSDCIDRR